MKKYVIFALVILVMSCGNKTTGSNETTEDTIGGTPQTSVEPVNHQDTERAGYTFKVSFRKDENDQCDALLLTCQSGDKKQEFVGEFNWPKDEDLLGDAGEITEEDINFDGIPDVVVYLGDFGVNPGLFSTLYYMACVWNPQRQSFERCEAYDELINPTVDAEKKVITCEYTNPIGDVFHEVYAWKDGKLTLTESTSHNELEDEKEEE